MKTENIAKTIAVVVGVVSVLVITGWVFDVPTLKSILPQWVTMKFTTAVAFFFSSIILYCMILQHKGKKEITDICILLAALVIVLIMGTHFLLNILGIQTGIETLFIREEAGAVATSRPGRPSLGTMLSFLLIVAAAAVSFVRSKKQQDYVRWLGMLLAAIGAVAIVGYIIKQPLLYYYVEGFSTAMAVHTAILFTLIGIGLILLIKQEREE